jgi:hypothetical protein
MVGPFRSAGTGGNLPGELDSNSHNNWRKEEITEMRRIGFVEYKPAEIKLPIYLDPRTDRLSCSYAGKTHEHTDIQQLKAIVLTAIKESVVLNWIPIIIITVGTSRNHHQAQIAVERDCKYYAYHETFGHKIVGWQVKPEARLANAETFSWPAGEVLTLPNQRDRHTFGMTYYLPYDPETWEALEEIEKYLMLAQKKLLNTLSSTAGVKTALQTCQLLFDAFTTRTSASEGNNAE